MEKGITFNPDLNGKGLRFGIVVARWNAICTTALKEQIISGLQNRGVEEKDIVIYEVPGSYELVYGAKTLIEKENVHAIIPIGVLIKGETLHFEYITDAAVNGEGLLLDDIAVPEVGYYTDLEADAGGWEAAGFVRIRNLLPQTYRLALIKVGDTTEVEFIELSADNVADIPLEIGDEVDEVILVVTGTTRYTRQKAAYRFEITQ